MLSNGPCPKFPCLNDETRFLMLGEKSVEYLSIKSSSFAPYYFGADLCPFMKSKQLNTFKNVLLVANVIVDVVVSKFLHLLPHQLFCNCNRFVALSNWFRMVVGAKMIACSGQIGLFMHPKFWHHNWPCRKRDFGNTYR